MKRKQLLLCQYEKKKEEKNEHTHALRNCCKTQIDTEADNQKKHRQLDFIFKNNDQK